MITRKRTMNHILLPQTLCMSGLWRIRLKISDPRRMTLCCPDTLCLVCFEAMKALDKRNYRLECSYLMRLDSVHVRNAIANSDRRRRKSVDPSGLPFIPLPNWRARLLTRASSLLFHDWVDPGQARDQNGHVHHARHHL